MIDQDKTMKFRDPKTGEVFEDIFDARERFCRGKDCDTCVMPNACRENLPPDSCSCADFTEKHPAEAAHLMGLEVVEEPAMGETQGGKPRICEVLGVEEFERICEAVHNGWWDEKKQQGVTDHPDMISYGELAESVKEYDRVTVRRVLDALGIRYEDKPRFSQEEAACMRVLREAGVRFVARDGDSTLYWYDCDIQWSGTEFTVGDGAHNKFGRLPEKSFPSLRPGQSVKLEEATGHDRSQAL